MLAAPPRRSPRKEAPSGVRYEHEEQECAQDHRRQRDDAQRAHLETQVHEIERHQGRLADRQRYQQEDLGNLRADQYDLVCNGLELASGGVRISDPKVQRKVFEIMGLSAEQTEERFGHLINAYEYGAPPHAGIAPGLDRFVSLLAGEKDIREVIAFPVNSSGQTSVMDAPSHVTEAQLREAGIMLRPTNESR